MCESKIPSVVYGKLLTVNAEDMKRLDYYESVDSGLYRREQVTVTDATSGDRITAYAYIFCAEPHEDTRMNQNHWSRNEYDENANN